MGAARHPGSARFHQLLTTIGELHDRKQADYGTDSDPFANVRSAEEWGLSPSLGACIRIGDKVARLKSFYRKGSLANESVEDAFMDLAVYALIGLVLYRQESESAEVAAEYAGPTDDPQPWQPGDPEPQHEAYPVALNPWAYEVDHAAWRHAAREPQRADYSSASSYVADHALWRRMRDGEARLMAAVRAEDFTRDETGPA